MACEFDCSAHLADTATLLASSVSTVAVYYSAALNAARAAGVRYVQAPLCGPSERRRRPRSLTFEQLTPLGSMNASHAPPPPPDFDPVAADWLPVQVYESNEYRASTCRKTHSKDGWQVMSHIAVFLMTQSASSGDFAHMATIIKTGATFSLVIRQVDQKCVNTDQAV